MKKSLLLLILALVVISGVVFLLVKPGEREVTPEVNEQDSLKEATLQTYAMTEVKNHASEQDCWMVINEQVYDVTEYIPSHPNNDILDGCGKEATRLFEGEREHRGKATKILEEYLIGQLTVN